MQQILATTEAVSKTWKPRSGSHDWSGRADVTGRQQVIVDVHTGGTWTVQARIASDGIWIDTDITFDDVGIKAYWASNELEYRLSGGTLGAQAHVTSVAGVY